MDNTARVTDRQGDVQPMDLAVTATRRCISVAAYAATLLGILILMSETQVGPELVSSDALPTLLVGYWLVGIVLTVTLWLLALLAILNGLDWTDAAMAALFGLLAGVISVSAQWPLYPLLGLGAFVVSESLAVRLRQVAVRR